MIIIIEYIIKDVSDISCEEYEECFYMMSPKRQEKVQRYLKVQSKKCTLAGEWLARKLLAKFGGKKENFYEIIADSRGKLYCKNAPDLYFNISHSRTKVIAAVSDREIGVDIEVIRPVSLKLAKKLCVPDELVYIFGKIPNEEDFKDNNNPEWIRRFFEIWTLKEAYFKCIGTGITGFDKLDSLNTKINKEKLENSEYMIHFVISDK